ncbi:MAG: hypothetical protein J6S97_09965 [Bacteroidales bacterium]|nr:hypothetical protein [Bacteroidales bacterium]
MKRLLILFAMMLSTSALAQVGGVEFTPYIPRQSQPQNQPQLDPWINDTPYILRQSPSNAKSNLETQNVSAFKVDVWGNYVTMRIRVEIGPSSQSAYSSNTNMRVVARYSRQTGTWDPIATKPIVYKCSYSSAEPMEQRFMYKAYVGTEYVYFDL